MCYGDEFSLAKMKTEWNLNSRIKFYFSIENYFNFDFELIGSKWVFLIPYLYKKKAATDTDWSDLKWKVMQVGDLIIHKLSAN